MLKRNKLALFNLIYSNSSKISGKFFHNYQNFTEDNRQINLKSYFINIILQK